MAVEIWEGAQAPAAYAQTMTAASVGGADLSTVTGASFIVQTPGGDETTWTASTSYNSGTSTLTVTHTFAVGSTDLISKPGAWKVFARLALPGGFLDAPPRELTVHPKFYVP